MLYIIRPERAHRTIARLLSVYDVVVVDIPLVTANGPWAFESPDLSKLVTGIGNMAGLNPKAFVPGEEEVVPAGDAEMTLHVVAGLHAVPEDERRKLARTIGAYSAYKRHASQRLLVLTDSLFIDDEPNRWAPAIDIGVVHVEGL